MSDATAKTIRSVALYLASIGEPTCEFQLPDRTIIVIHAAETLNPGESLPPPPLPIPLPTVAANCKNPKPYPIYFPLTGILNPGAPRQDCTHCQLAMNNLIRKR